MRESRNNKMKTASKILVLLLNVPRRSVCGVEDTMILRVILKSLCWSDGLVPGGFVGSSYAGGPCDDMKSRKNTHQQQPKANRREQRHHWSLPCHHGHRHHLLLLLSVVFWGRVFLVIVEWLG